jgi:hypothetical protein
MASNSLTGFLALGKQADRTTQATTLYKALSLTSGLGVAFDESDDLKEHPSTVAGTSFALAAAKTRTGFLVPWAGNFILRPKFFPVALQSIGFAVSSSAGDPEAGANTHTCTVAADAAMLWMSVVHNVGGSSFSRRALSARASQLNITATNTDIRCDIAGTALDEGNVSGTPTYVSEVTTQILPTVGSITCNFDSATLTSTIRGATINIAQQLKDGKEELPLFQANRNSLDRQNFGITGDLQGVDADFDLWKKIIRGGTSGTAPSLVVVPGDLEITFSSAGDMGATGTPYSVTFNFPSIQYTLPTEGIRNNADDLVRVAVGWNMLADVATPVTVTVVNDVASY